jgi:hypothetical protein
MVKKITLATIAEKMERGFGAIAADITELKGDIADIRQTMATKDNIKDMATKDDVRAIVREETADIRSELTSIRRDLNDLGSKLDNLSGVTKEIDHAFERIRRIERHLGIEADLAA